MTGDVRSVLTDTLAQHRPSSLRCYPHQCRCGEEYTNWSEHLTDVILGLPGVAVTQLPEPDPDETVHPYWSVDDVNGPQVVGVEDGDSDEDYVSIEFTARSRTVTADTAEALGGMFLAAAREARKA